MKTLLILRHAKSSWKDERLADRDRPLSKRGQRDAPRVGDLLRKKDLLPDLILSSTARRARNTAEAVVDASDYGGELWLDPELYAAAPDAILEALRKLPDSYERVLLVGHNPGLEELVELLTGESESLPTAALAQVELPVGTWESLSAEIQGRLVGVWQPREEE